MLSVRGPNEAQVGAHPVVGHWTYRWINCCISWCKASAMPDLRLSSHLPAYATAGIKLILLGDRGTYV